MCLWNESILVQSLLKKQRIISSSLYVLAVFSLMDPISKHISLKFIYLHHLNKSTDLFRTELLHARWSNRINLLKYFWRFLFDFSRSLLCMKTVTRFTTKHCSSIFLQDHSDWFQISHGIVSYAAAKAEPFQMFLHEKRWSRSVRAWFIRKVIYIVL